MKSSETRQNEPATGEALRRVLEPRGIEIRETHISWVFLAEREVWKVKKPVDFGFLDFTTADKRRQACGAEVELNRRLAPEIYLGVVPVVRDQEGALGFGQPDDDRAAVDWAVHMVRLSDDRRADRLLERGALDPAQVDRLAELLARFHAGARADGETARYGSLEVVAGNVQENFEQTRDTIEHYLSRREAAEIEAWQTRFLERHVDLFSRRVAAGRVRDGHGDLRLDHVYFEQSGDAAEGGQGEHGERGGVTIIDCIEFNRRFRFADVCADLAFLAMDLSWRGRSDLAERLLATYARAAGDYDLYPLVDFYESYRAFVRAKVSTLLAQEEEAPVDVRQKAGEEARRYFLLALASERRSLLPLRVVAVGGVIATGKSTVARRVADRLDAPIVDADHTRKSILGVSPETPLHHQAFSGAYTPERSEQTYDEVLRRADAVLRSGRPVVVDASFRAARHRLAVRRLARRHGVPFHFIECRAEADVCRQRLHRRAKERGVSDGRLEIFDDFVARYEPVAELAEDEHLVLDTGRPLVENERLLARSIPGWPEGFEG